MTEQKENNTQQTFLAKLVFHPYFQPAIMILILINAIVVGLETYPGIYEGNEHVFFTIDLLLLWLFTIEIAMRMIATRPTWHFFKDPWNVFDFVIVGAGHIFVGAHFVTVLRVLRVLRVFRAISIFPSLRRLVNALLLTIPALGNITILLSLIFYIFSVIGTMLYADIAPEYFGSLHLSLITLFQVVTLESWASEVMRPIMAMDPYAWIYFVSFILIGSFVIVNLFVGVIVNNVERANVLDTVEPEDDEPHTQGDTETRTELQHLRQEIAELKTIVQQQQRTTTMDHDTQKDEGQ